MSGIRWVLLASVGLAAASQVFKLLRTKELSDISDESFVSIYEKRFGASNRMVIDGRRMIAKFLGLPSLKLTPNQRFEELSRYTGFITEYEVGMGDLESELEELCERAGIEKPDPFPETVGDLIYAMVRAKEMTKN